MDKGDLFFLGPKSAGKRREASMEEPDYKSCGKKKFINLAKRRCLKKCPL